MNQSTAQNKQEGDMENCNICGARHSGSPELCEYTTKKYIHSKLAETFDLMLGENGDTPAIRLMIATYTIGYMGVSHELHSS